MNVEHWLSELFVSPKKPNVSIKKAGNKGVPSFEKNQTTNQILSDLRDANLSADLQAGEEIKIMKILTKEHIAETARLTNILRPLKLDVGNLPDELRKLVEIISVANQKAQELEETTEISTKLPDLSVSQTQALQRLQNLEKIQESLHHMNIRDSHEQLARKKETEFLSKKIGEYAGHVRHLEVKKIGSGRIYLRDWSQIIRKALKRAHFSRRKTFAVEV
ncbi:uncharacterized protein LOC124314226 isoform X2 [Daphnia pulicaria]|uniref:uncharacterized protein LOC124314226 isoform X2 n=1 Tax=Daphnia pulicaria TaxID=35523 RepID=UPI001EEBD037|nr:uncharacterized protein LOC124314226 isoform X2 [Daphnia pulicaria]